MKPSFLNRDKALLTVMLPCRTQEDAIQRIRHSLTLGAEAYGLQAECLAREYQNPETYKKLFAEMQNLPVYVTNYRTSFNTGKTDDELAAELITLVENGATLCDVMGDLYCRHPYEITDDKSAVNKQMRLIDKLHEIGAEVLMSSHICKFTSAERVLEIALEQKRRGADIVKIVTGAENTEQQLENLKITALLNKELESQFLFLSGGECTIHRRLGWKLGCAMILCVDKHDELSTPAQPLLAIAKAVRDDMGF